MDLRKINSYMILLAIVVVVGLFVSTVARLVILAKGVDAGTANLVFLRRQTNDFSNGRKNRSNCSDVMGIER